MRAYVGLVIVLAVIVGFPRPEGRAEPGDTAGGPVVAELFTSQGCSSCPPAEALFGQLAERDDLIVIEWHVDYWDDLVYGSAGRWEDPFSSPDHTNRQRDYNANLRGTRSVYTPQAIIGGQREAVGSSSRDVSALIDSDAGAPTPVNVTRLGDQLEIGIAPNRVFSGRAEVRLVKLKPSEVTRVRAGENKGRTLASRNIALGSERLATYSGEGVSVTGAAPAAGEHCALIVQAMTRPGPGEILGAAYCPA